MNGERLHARHARPGRCSTIAKSLLAASLVAAFAGPAGPAVAQERSDRIEELVVNATRLPRTIEDIAGTVSLITAEDIERELVEDLDDLARFQPGVSISTARRGGNEGFSIRGIGGNRVLTVIDGIRSNDIYHAGPASYGRDSIDTDNIKTVELIRGPASALYGADAIGGAVILTSKEPRDYLDADRAAFNLRASAADADEQYRGGFTAAFQLADIGLLAQYTHREFAEQEVNGPGSLNPQDGDSDSLLLQMYWDLSPDHQLRLGMDSFVEEVATRLDSEIGRSVSRSSGEDDTERLRAGVRYRWQAGLALFDDLELDLNRQETDASQYTEQTRTSYSFLNPRDPRTYGGTDALRKSTFDFDQRTLALNLNLRKTVATDALTHSLAYGANIEETDTRRPRNRCDEELASGQATCRISAYPFAPPEVFPNKTIPDTSTTRSGIYLQDEIVFGERGFTLIPGARYDRYRMQATPDPSLDGTGQVGVRRGEQRPRDRLAGQLRQRIPECGRLPEPLHELHRERVCGNQGTDQPVSEPEHRQGGNPRRGVWWTHPARPTVAGAGRARLCPRRQPECVDTAGLGRPPHPGDGRQVRRGVGPVGRRGAAYGCREERPGLHAGTGDRRRLCPGGRRRELQLLGLRALTFRRVQRL